MNIKKVILGLTLSLLLASGVASAADYEAAYSTYKSGNFKAAFKETLPFAKQGNVNAQFLIAYMYDNGQGVLENDKAAVKWYTLAAEQGDAVAQNNLGIMYAGGKGVAENDRVAAKWFIKAAEQGYADAQYNLGLKYVYGEGVLTDNRRAYMWWNLSAYNDGPKRASENKESVAEQMTPADISKAQDMSNICLESNYTDC